MVEKVVRHRSECFNRFLKKGDFSVMYIESKKYGIKEVLIDTDKIPELSKIFWHVAKMYDGYFSVIGWDKEKQKEVSIHRYLTKCPKGLLVDHINRNPLDNRIKNLRCVGIAENQLNRGTQKNSKSGYKGVRLRKDYGKYQARIMINKKAISIGHFNTLLEAVIARQKFCEEHNIIA